MTEPILTVLRRISDQPNDLSPFAIASWCGKAADAIECLQSLLDAEMESNHRLAAEELRLQSKVEALEELATDLQKFVDLQAEDEGLWGVAQYASEAYIQRGLRGCHQFIEESLAKLQESDSDSTDNA